MPHGFSVIVHALMYPLWYRGHDRRDHGEGVMCENELPSPSSATRSLLMSVESLVITIPSTAMPTGDLDARETSQCTQEANEIATSDELLLKVISYRWERHSE